MSSVISVMSHVISVMGGASSVVIGVIGVVSSGVISVISGVISVVGCVLSVVGSVIRVVCSAIGVMGSVIRGMCSVIAPGRLEWLFARAVAPVAHRGLIVGVGKAACRGRGLCRYCLLFVLFAGGLRFRGVCAVKLLLVLLVCRDGGVLVALVFERVVSPAVHELACPSVVACDRVIVGRP